MHYPDDEPSCDFVSAFDFDFELYSLKKDEFKDLIFDEIMMYHDENLLKEYMQSKAHYPTGMLHKKFAKDRIRKKYKMSKNE